MTNERDHNDEDYKMSAHDHELMDKVLEEERERRKREGAVGRPEDVRNYNIASTHEEIVKASNLMLDWLKEKCAPAPSYNAAEQSSALYKAYKEWMEFNYYRDPYFDVRDFGLRMIDFGYPAMHKHGRRIRMLVLKDTFVPWEERQRRLEQKRELQTIEVFKKHFPDRFPKKEGES
jgi:hypothetical protein